jgi:hypothetical protein
MPIADRSLKTEAMATGCPVTPPRPLVVADGTESVEGRALLLVSALHFAAAGLAGCDIAFVGVADAAVRAAIDDLRWATSLAATVEQGDPAVVLAGARLYCAIVFRDTAHLALAAARRLQVPTVIGVQFPALRQPPHDAHDPRLFAAKLIAAVGGR